MAQKISSTALTVIQGVLYIAQHPKYSTLVTQELKADCIQMLSSSIEGRKRLEKLEKAWFRALVPYIERLIMPGITLHYVMRKKYIEHSLLVAIQQGASQVINLGAGLDTLCSRIANKNQHISFIELDLPATQELKKQALRNSTKEKQANLHLVSIDFAKQQLKEVLNFSDVIEPDKPTVCVLEGVLMYLPHESVEYLFAELRAYFGRGVRIIFTSAPPPSANKNSYGLVLKAYLSIAGEPLKYTIEKQDIEPFLNQQGYSLIKTADSSDFRRLYLSKTNKHTVHEGEYIAIADCNWN